MILLLSKRSGVVAWIALAGLIAAGPPAHAAVSANGDGAETTSPLVLKPVLLDSLKSAGATLGLDYKYERQWVTNVGGDDVLADRVIEVRGEGTIAASADRNPNKLLDLAANARYDYLGEGWRGGAGGSLKAESDQGFDNRQLLWALQFRGGWNNPLGGRGWALGYLNLGRIEPGADVIRKKTLGGVDLKSYRRWDAELIYHKDLKGQVGPLVLKSLEFAYRHFQEVSASAGVKQAGIDRHRLGTVRLNVGDEYFVAYSRGRLPFDKQSDRSIKVGWTYKFE